MAQIDLDILYCQKPQHVNTNQLVTTLQKEIELDFSDEILKEAQRHSKPTVKSKAAIIPPLFLLLQS